jgi:hypothetical protein
MSATTGFPMHSAPYRFTPVRPALAYPPAGYPGNALPWQYPPPRFSYSPAVPSIRPATAPVIKPVPTPSSRLIAAVKAIALITPAILLAKFAPGTVRNELLPSDWKVWAKILLGIGSLNQANQALNWQPPPWLNAMMNVTLMTPLISGWQKGALKSILVLAPAVGGLVQGTHWLSGKAEKPLQDHFNIPPVATRLALSVASMGVGLWSLPKVFKLSDTLGLTSKQESAAVATTIAQSCPYGCCGGSAICLNEVVNYGGALGNWFHRSITGKKADS